MFTDKLFSISSIAHSITLWILLILSVFSVAFIFERWFILRKISNNSRRILTRLKDSLKSLNFDEVEGISQNYDSIEGRALKYGLKYIKVNGLKGLEEVLNSYFLIEKMKIERFLNFLATVGSNAPFVGLLGTVFGIMDAFRELASQQGDVSAVMIGISKALIATAVGLLVALPAVIAYNSFQKQVKSILESFEVVGKLCVAYAKNLEFESTEKRENKN